MRSVLLMGALLGAGCGDEDTDTASGGTADTDLFCRDIADADSYEIRQGDVSGANGSLYGRIITDEVDDLTNPNFVAQVTYILENLDVGGSPRYGESSDGGEIIATLGAGRWRIQLSNNRVAGYTCYNDQEFVIEAGQITELCLDVACE